MSNTEYAYFTVWNMNGGPVPSNTVESVTKAIENLLKEVEDKDGVRLLYSLVTKDSEAN